MARDQSRNRIDPRFGDTISIFISFGIKVTLRRINNPEPAIELPRFKFRQINLKIRFLNRINLDHISQRNIDMRIERQRFRMKR